MEENELKKAIAEAYWKGQGSGLVADQKAFNVLFKTWKESHPAPPGSFWGIGYPSHEPVLMTSAG
jgi:hypothetical protein